MTRSTRVPVPGFTLLFLGIACVLAAMTLFYLLSNGWRPHLGIPHFPLGSHQSGKARLSVKVWVNKSTGIYYCPDSPMYGRTESGAYMVQGEAVQTGYSPALSEPCE
jgi:hypothetical protein